jgi:hypothetical protein
MEKFLSILTNELGEPDYLHPSELYGSSKKDVYACLTENVPPESIIGIYTVNEYKTFVQSSTFKNIILSNARSWRTTSNCIFK